MQRGMTEHLLKKICFQLKFQDWCVFMCLLRFATVEQSLLQTLQKVLPSCTGLWSARLVLLENSFPQISQAKLYCRACPHAPRAASKWSRNKTALEMVQNLYYRLFDLYGFTGHKFPGGLFSGVDSGCSLLIQLFHRLCRWSCHHVLLGGWTNSWDSQTSCHTEGTGRALAFHRSLWDMNRDWQGTHSSKEWDLRQGKESKASHACWKIYIAPSEIQLVLVVRLWIRAGQVDCGTPSYALQGYF